MDLGAWFSVCGGICFLGVVVGAIVAIAILLRKKYGDQDRAD